MSSTLKEVDYTCSNPKCKSTQTIRYFADDKILPVTCCVACKAGFGVELMQQIAGHKGMFPTSEPRIIGN